MIVGFGDEQFVIRVWHLLGLYHEFWGDMIPFPGDLHGVMHVALGIMRVGEDYLVPLAKHLGYKYIKVDFELKAWSQHDHFLILVAEGSTRWLQGKIPQQHKHLNFAAVMKKIAPNKHISI